MLEILHNELDEEDSGLPTLDELAHEGARRMLLSALDAEVAAYLGDTTRSVTRTADAWSYATAVLEPGR